MPKSKAKTDSSQQGVQVCVLHSGIDHGQFTSFKKMKGDPHEKLSQLLIIRDKRLAQPTGSVHRMEAVCSLIPTTLEGLDLDAYGYHRQCYQRFHLNLNRLKDSSAHCISSEQSTSGARHHSPRKKCRVAEGESPLFLPECIFCEKFEIKVKGKTERPVRFASWKHKDSAWQQIELQAKELGQTRLYRQVQGQDLHAAEAQCHPSCRDRFRDTYRNHLMKKERAKNQDQDTEQTHRAAAHVNAFDRVLQVLSKNVIDQNNIMQLSSLRLVYIEQLERNNYPNPSYQSEKLLRRLQKHAISDLICFTKVNPGDKGCLSFILIYSKDITVAEAVAYSYKLGSVDKYAEVALHIRALIQKAYRESKEIPWPPTADDLEINPGNILPNELLRFLALVFTGAPEAVEDKISRFILSIGQDMCRVVTGGEWKLPKHILLCNTIRHLYRSKQLTTILYKLGHCESYNFGLELETAMTVANDDMSTYLTPQIVTGEGNALFHCEWDNLNKILTNVHGSNIVNSAAGIMIQEINPEYQQAEERRMPTYIKSGERSLKADPPRPLPEIAIYKRAGPKFPPDATFTHPIQNEQVYDSKMQEYYAWLICRMVGSGGKQPVPALGGFISATGDVPKRKSIIDYFTPIHQPITEYSTVQELLKRTEEATVEVAGGEGGQKYVINTFDLGVCMKALPLVWQWPDKYKKHIILPGQFHTAMNYMGMITGHKCRGSGYAEILLEAQLVTSGCLKSVLSGKAYSKALFCLKTVCEAMERLMMEQFIQE